MCESVNYFLFFRLKNEDVLSLECLVPELVGFEQNLNQRIEDSLEIGEALVYPYVAVILYQRIAVIQISEHSEEARLTYFLQLFWAYYVAVLGRQVPE